ncbi:MAG TPA: glycosyltransferase family 2 protein [Steroidobacteraceae bacterium]|jgi:glycosyltransferase involved in cell wall biosynthesis|nr:glycosyltransferase family 2 protein [Steroidobacteraceae bacterium]
MTRTPEPNSSAAPRVSVGMPVYNGENFIAEAIASVLAQTLTDLELIIQDNASTDRTAEICAHFAANDPRVRYFRNPRNLGAAPNYNLAYQMARGRYFKWLAHDDRLTPRYLEVTARALDERPDAVLCNTIVRYIDAQGAVIGDYDSGLAKADLPSPAARFALMVLSSHSCVDFFGLHRRDSLKHSLLHGSFHGADRALLAQMALRGRFIQIPEPLVEMREHGNRYTRSQVSSTQRRSWHDATLKGRITFPTWRLYTEYLKLVRDEPLRFTDRLRCYGVLSHWWATNWNALRAAVDLLAVIAPSAPGRAENLKTRIFGAAPGHFLKERR